MKTDKPTLAPLEPDQIEYVRLARGVTRCTAAAALRAGFKPPADWREQLTSLRAAQDAELAATRARERPAKPDEPGPLPPETAAAKRRK